MPSSGSGSSGLGDDLVVVYQNNSNLTDTPPEPADVPAQIKNAIAASPEGVLSTPAAGSLLATRSRS